MKKSRNVFDWFFDRFTAGEFVAMLTILLAIALLLIGFFFGQPLWILSVFCLILALLFLAVD